MEEADTEALVGLGSAFEDLESSEVEQLRDQLLLRFEWEVGRAEVTGRRAVVPVKLSSREAETAPPRTEETILVPMRWRSGSWRIESSLTVTQQIDLVPLKK